MKKLLNILNILIISGTIIPTIVITSDYNKKQVTLKNNKEINYLQANNLEILQRNKRELKYNYYYINTNNYEQQHLNNTDNLEGDIITMKINENGDALVGTTNGLYFKKNDPNTKYRKINNINGNVKEIHFNNKNPFNIIIHEAFIITDSGNYYYINTSNFEQQHLNNTDNLEGDIITMAIDDEGVVYHTHFVDCNKTRKNNKIYNLKYKKIIKNDKYINKNYKIDTLKNSLNKTL